MKSVWVGETHDPRRQRPYLLRLLFCAAACCLTTTAANAQQWNVVHSRGRSLEYKIVARDGVEFRTTVNYTARVWKKQFQTGHSANWPKTFRDTRTCHWDFFRDHDRTHASTVVVDTGRSVQLKHPERIDGDVYVADLLGSDGDGLVRLVNQAALWFGAHELASYWDRMTEDGRDDFERTLWIAAAPIFVPAEVGGMAIARLLGLRKGPNCGEAGQAIATTEQLYRRSIDSQISTTSEIDHYLLWYELRRSWAYWNEDREEWVYARRVTPLLRGDAFYPFAASRVADVHRYWTGNDPSADELRRIVEEHPGPDWELEIVRRYVEDNFDRKLAELQDLPAPTMDPAAILALQRFSIGTVDVSEDGGVSADIVYSQGPPAGLDVFSLRRLLEPAGAYVHRICGEGTLHALIPDGATGSPEQDGFREAFLRRQLVQILSSIPRMNAGPLFELRLALPEDDPRTEALNALLADTLVLDVPLELDAALSADGFRDCAIRSAVQFSTLRELAARVAGQEREKLENELAESLSGRSVDGTQTAVDVVTAVLSVPWIEFYDTELSAITDRTLEIPFAALIQARVVTAGDEVAQALAEVAPAASVQEATSLIENQPTTSPVVEQLRVEGTLTFTVPDSTQLFPTPEPGPLTEMATRISADRVDVRSLIRVR